MHIYIHTKITLCEICFIILDRLCFLWISGKKENVKETRCKIRNCSNFIMLEVLFTRSCFFGPRVFQLVLNATVLQLWAAAAAWLCFILCSGIITQLIPRKLFRAMITWISRKPARNNSSETFWAQWQNGHCADERVVLHLPAWFSWCCNAQQASEEDLMRSCHDISFVESIA